MATQSLTSVHNPHVKAIAALHTPKGRAQAGAFIAEGLRACQTLIGSKCRLQRLYVLEEFESQALQLVAQNAVCIVTESVMKKISTSATPSGIVGMFAIPPVKVPEKLKSGLVLCQLSDPGNMGTLIRSAVAFGFTDVIVVGGADVWNPKVVQASAGTIGHARIIGMAWADLVAHAQRPPLAALVARGGTVLQAGAQNVLLVVGNEAHGLPDEFVEQCQLRLTLPMSGEAESLNAAVAGSIALYLISAR